MAPRTRRRTPVVLVVVGALVLGLGAVATLAVCSTFGCHAFSESFEPEGAEASAARARETAVLTSVADRLGAGERVLARTTLDDCLTGQDNWKVKDTYSHECFVRDSRVLDLAAARDDVGPALTAFDERLRAQGCATSSGGLDDVRREYWTDDNPNVARLGAAGLPGSRYDCPDGTHVEARPSAAQALTEGAAAGTGLGPDPTGDEVLHGRPFSEADVAAVRGSGSALALVVTVSRPYYRTTF